MPFGFAYIVVDGEERPQCLLCAKILAADIMKLNKLERHTETMHAKQTGKTPDNKQKKHMQK